MSKKIKRKDFVVSATEQEKLVTFLRSIQLFGWKPEPGQEKSALGHNIFLKCVRKKTRGIYFNLSQEFAQEYMNGEAFKGKYYSFNLDNDREYVEAFEYAKSQMLKQEEVGEVQYKTFEFPIFIQDWKESLNKSKNQTYDTLPREVVPTCNLHKRMLREFIKSHIGHSTSKFLDVNCLHNIVSVSKIITDDIRKYINTTVTDISKYLEVRICYRISVEEHKVLTFLVDSDQFDKYVSGEEQTSVMLLTKFAE